jgi:hypothetical protein
MLGIVPKRAEEFSYRLGIPSKFLGKTTNLYIDEIEKILKNQIIIRIYMYIKKLISNI